jgi:hypothetical protein
MKRVRAIACAALLLALGGCTTKYEDQNWTGGYGEKQLESNVWRVSFHGNGFTTPETVQTFWLYRCAELTLAKGYSGFVVVSDIQLVNVPGALTGGQFIQVHGGGGGGGYFYYYRAPDVAKPSLEADIRMLQKPFSVSPPKMFDAAALKQTLEPFVKGELCSGNVCPHPHTYLHAPAAGPQAS